MSTVGRRTFLGLVAGGVAPAVAIGANQPAPVGAASMVDAKSAASKSAPLILNAAQFAFVCAAVDLIIPADELSPSGTECGVADFIDRQLAGRWGAGGGSYRSGPFLAGRPEYGEQLGLTPLEFFRAAIGAINGWTQSKYGGEFDQLAPRDREDAFRALEQGKSADVDIDAGLFFSQFRRLAIEGFFADPIYGGNRGKVAWQMIGYPGLPSLYAQTVNSLQTAPVRLPSKSIEDFR